MLHSAASPDAPLSPDAARDLLARVVAEQRWDGQRVLAIIPDGTRTAAIPLVFALLGDLLAPRTARLDYLIALGTHPPMSNDAIDRLVGVPALERAARYPRTTIFNHEWSDLAALTTIGTISRDETAMLTDGLLVAEVPVRLNRRIFDYDALILCGPVFPHEVAGFSGGAKYLFPGIAGAEIIDYTHWLGALSTSLHTIGVQDTLVRRVIHRAAAFVPRPILTLALVHHGPELHGIYVGDYREAFAAAADLSAQLNIIWTPRRYRQVLSMPAHRYDDLWTAAKAMYKTEPVVEDGGEVIIYAPHLREVSYMHGALIEEVGYHVRDYFLAQWDRFTRYPGSILAHSTHVKGAGTYDSATSVEHPRIQVTLATGITADRCARINLGYRDPATINSREWIGREADGILVVEHAGEMLYRPLQDRVNASREGTVQASQT
jgi:nickel-dependent lactate racemase